jgi:protease-4
MRTLFLMTSLCIIMSCAPQVYLFPDTRAPLKEFTLQGQGADKVLVISVNGLIRHTSREGWLRESPGTLQEVVAHLKQAEKDKHVKAVVLKVDSPGGTTTASDMLYHELVEFKQHTGAKLVAVMMNMATSGGYYISLPADRIVAHPTSITGAVGVIFMRPGVSALMERIGMAVEINKSGKNKDMGSPFRKPSPEEQVIFQEVTDGLAKRFFDLVMQHRHLTPEATTRIATGRIFLAHEALQLGLVDSIGYLSDAIKMAQSLTGLPEDARVVVYRRQEYGNDNLYNSASQGSDGGGALLDLGLPKPLSTGFYYLWPAYLQGP